MAQHLAFLKRFKGVLKLKLNAAEDLLVNGVRQPSDRGVCRHLLAKVDRASVQKALAAGGLSQDRAVRARFLAGVCRIHADEDWLLAYLGALAEDGERRTAATAFAQTIDRFDFASMSSSRVSKLLEVIDATFTGHDRSQALLGLMDNRSFGEMLVRTQDSLPQARIDELAPLVQVHRVVFQKQRPPGDERARADFDSGLAELLAAPQAVLQSYPERVRARLATFAMKDGLDDADARASTRKLLDGLSGRDGAHGDLARARSEQLLRAGEVDEAKRVIEKLDGPHRRWGDRMERVLGGERLGEVMVDAKKLGRDDALATGVWLPGPTFAWIRAVPASDAGRLDTEARLQASLLMLGVAHVLGHGLGPDGTAWVAIASGGRRFEGGPPHRALELASDGVRLLGQLAGAGVELPDLDDDRFLSLGGAKITLANLKGALRKEPAAAQIAHGPIALAWARRRLDGVENLPEAVTRRLHTESPLPVLAEALISATVEVLL